MALSSFEPGGCFADELAALFIKRSLAGAGELFSEPEKPRFFSEGLFLLPTRRSIRALTEAFLRYSGGKALILPTMKAIGETDEASLILAASSAGQENILPPAVTPLKRLSVLTELILALKGKNGAPLYPDGAWQLAENLAALTDEAERLEIDLNEELPKALGGDFALHWQKNLEFLQIIMQIWPAWLAEEGLMNPVARWVRLLRLQIALWAEKPPQGPVFFVGRMAGAPVLYDLAKAVMNFPQGEVFLQGLDTGKNAGLPEQIFAEVPPAHPQYGFRKLLEALQKKREDVKIYPVTAKKIPAGREAFLTQVMLPPDSLSQWRFRAESAVIEGISVIEAADENEEAQAIAIAVREALEVPGKRIALVTPDRQLALRVTAALGRFGIVADDSAGELLADTPVAVFLRLLMRTAESGFEPVTLLSLLKHPFTRLGEEAGQLRKTVRLLDFYLRGSGLGGRGQNALSEMKAFFAAKESADFAKISALLLRVEQYFAPLTGILSRLEATPVMWLKACLEVAEALSLEPQSEILTGEEKAQGYSLLWTSEEGAALAKHVAALSGAWESFAPDVAEKYRYADFFEETLRGERIRTRRALRGSSGGAEHPRVQIWGVLEAQLQSADLLILGGLNEGIWPQTGDSGPWLNRLARQAVGLSLPEEKTGYAALDFTTICLSAPEIILSRSRQRERTPVLPSRWLTRAEVFLNGHQKAFLRHDALFWAREVDLPVAVCPVKRPEPVPPVKNRPTRLSITDIDKWFADPYALYAKYILQLKALDFLTVQKDQLDFGNLVHNALEKFYRENGKIFLTGQLPAEEAKRRLAAFFEQELIRCRLRPSLRFWWRPRLALIANSVIATDKERPAAGGQIIRVGVEKSGEWIFSVNSPLTLRGRADRIDITKDGQAVLIDYKTGTLPTAKQTEAVAFQLPLGAAFILNGAFGKDWQAPVKELIYWSLSKKSLQEGNFLKRLTASEEETKQAVQAAFERLAERVRVFADPATSYPHFPSGNKDKRFPELARTAEWSR